MPRRGGWKTILKYAAGILALLASVAVAWFLPGLYAGWQDAQTQERVVLSRRENIQFLDTASLDIAGRLQMFENMAHFSWDWDYNGAYMGLGTPTEEMVDRCRDEMEDWCEAGLFPGECLSGIAPDNLLAAATAIVYLDNAMLQAYCFRFHEVDGYAVTLVADADVGMIYYASVSGPAMLDVIAEDLGFESFGAMAEYEMELMADQGIDPDTLNLMVEADEYEDMYEVYSKISEDLEQNVRPADASRYDFAAVCGAQGMEPRRQFGNLALDVELSFETFTGHAHRQLISADYDTEERQNGQDIGIGFAVTYGAYEWGNLVSDFAATYGSWEGFPDNLADWHALVVAYAVGDPETLETLRYPGAAETEKALPDDEAYDMAEKEKAEEQAIIGDNGQEAAEEYGSAGMAFEG